MRMKIERVTDGEIVLTGNVHDIRSIRHFVGQEVELKIEPVVRFHHGDRVTRRRVLAAHAGAGETITQHTIRSGPHVFEGKPGTFWLPYDSNEFIPDGELAPYTNGEW